MRTVAFRARWAVPVAVVSTVGVVIAASAVASAVATPSLPARTAAQLLAEMQQGLSKPLGPFTATVQQSSAFGLPALPLPAQADGSANVLAGTQTTNLWYLDPQHIRVSQPVQMGETDLRLDGHTMWLWNSKTQTATRVQLPTKINNYKAGNGFGPPPPGTEPKGGNGNATEPSPLAAAKQILAAVGPSTKVTVQRNLYVAGRAAYQLSFAPKSNGSLIGQILIAVDAQKHIPLRLQVVARGASSPAFSLGFTALTFGPPAMSNFTFTPPAGATVKTRTVPSALPPGLGMGMPPLGALGKASSSVSFGSGGIPVSPGPAQRIPKQVLKQLRASFIKSLPKNMGKAQRAAAIKAFDKHFVAGSVANPGNNGGGFVNVPPPLPLRAQLRATAPRVIGKDWLSVIATPADPGVAAAVNQLLTGKPGPAAYAPVSPASPCKVANCAGPGHIPIGPGLAVVHALLRAATPVHGSWGSGRLLQTALFSVLITRDGRILFGAVTPAVLYQDVTAAAK